MSSHDAGAALLLASAPRLLLATFLLAGVASWLLQRPAGSSGGGSGRTHQPVAAADFFGRIRERLNHQAAPGGAEGGFEWTQTSDEVELAVPLEAHVRARDVDFHILPTSVALRIKGAASPLLEGKLHRRVKSDECCWAIDGEGDRRSLKLTLVKQTPTKGSLHWTSVLEAAPAPPAS